MRRDEIERTTTSGELLAGSVLSDDELDTECFMMLRFFATDRASRANLLSAAENTH